MVIIVSMATNVIIIIFLLELES